MRRLLSLFALLALLTPISLRARTFEGKIIFQMQTAKGSQSLVSYYSGSKSRTEVNANGHSSVVLFDFQAKSMAILMPERKAYMRQSLAQGRTASQGANGNLRKSGATDSVAGYPVEEWIYETAQGKTSIWLTDKLGAGLYGQSMASRDLEIPEELKGRGVLALRIVGRNGFRMEATKVVPGPVNSGYFEIPGDYSEMTAPGAGASASNSGSSESGSSIQNSMNAMPPDQAARVKAAMDNMSPEQKAALEKAMQGQGQGN